MHELDDAKRRRDAEIEAAANHLGATAPSTASIIIDPTFTGPSHVSKAAKVKLGQKPPIKREPAAAKSRGIGGGPARRSAADGLDRSRSRSPCIRAGAAPASGISGVKSEFARAVKTERGSSPTGGTSHTTSIQLDLDGTPGATAKTPKGGRVQQMDVQECLQDENGGAFGRSTGPVRALSAVFFRGPMHVIAWLRTSILFSPLSSMLT